MATQLDLFSYQNNDDIIRYQVEKLKDDIDKMRRSFFVRLDAQEKKYQLLLDQLNKEGHGS